MNKRHDLLLRWLIRFGTKGIYAEDIRSEFNEEEIALVATIKYNDNYAISVELCENKHKHAISSYGLECIKDLGE